jgi:hypothetical protein
MTRWDLTLTLRHPMAAGPVVGRVAEEHRADHWHSRRRQRAAGVERGPRPGTFTISFADWAVGSTPFAASLAATTYRNQLVSLIGMTPALFAWKVEVTATPPRTRTRPRVAHRRDHQPATLATPQRPSRVHSLAGRWADPRGLGSRRPEHGQSTRPPQLRPIPTLR